VQVTNSGRFHFKPDRARDTSGDIEVLLAPGNSTLLVRRHRYTGTLSFNRCWSATPRPLHQLVSVVW
jgi:hypothetical protein